MMSRRTRQCVVCGRSIDWNASFCTYCGTPYVFTGPALQPAPVYACPASVRESPRPSFLKLVSDNLVSIAIIVTSLYFLWWGIYGAYSYEHYGADDALWLMDIVLSSVVCLTLLFVGLITMKRRHP
jgi:hypothetical protein